MREQKSLKHFFNRYDCDKSSKHSYHELYDPIFQKIFSEKREEAETGMKPIITLLEIGTFKGNSALAFHDYITSHGFQPLIISVDLFERVRKKDVEARMPNNYEIILLEGDSTKVKIDVSCTFDIIIDDGCHFPEIQKETFENLKSHLNLDGSVYIIEDVWPIELEMESHPWLLKHKKEFTKEKYDTLLTTFGDHTIYDGREKTGEPDSFCLVKTF